MKVYEEIIKTMPEDKKFNWNGSSINLIMCYYENKIKNKKSLVLSTKNVPIEMRALMFDGLMVYGNYYDNTELRREIEQQVNEKFKDLDQMIFDFKPHNETIVMPSDFDVTKSLNYKRQTKIFT